MKTFNIFLWKKMEGKEIEIWRGCSLIYILDFSLKKIFVYFSKC